jgi:hypothetical protein
MFITLSIFYGLKLLSQGFLYKLAFLSGFCIEHSLDFIIKLVEKSWNRNEERRFQNLHITSEFQNVSSIETTLHTIIVDETLNKLFENMSKRKI